MNAATEWAILNYGLLVLPVVIILAALLWEARKRKP